MYMDITDYQKTRIKDIHNWYISKNQNSQIHDVQIQYIVLWAVFNALYNVLDYPKREVRGVDGNIPRIWGSSESQKLKQIAKVIAKEEMAIKIIIGKHLESVQRFASRHPTVRQPNQKGVLEYEYQNQKYTFDVGQVEGIASTDNRIILPDDEGTIFHYQQLNLDLDRERFPNYPEKFIEQLVFYLYQIRNNIVHGGTASFSMDKKSIADDGMRILDEIIKYLFRHQELLIEMSTKPQ